MHTNNYKYINNLYFGSNKSSVLKSLYLFLILISFFSSSLFSQTLLRGTVTNLSTGAPLESVSVSASKEKTKTDSLGTFTLTLPHGKHTIRISAIGYKTFERRVELLGSDAELKISMEPEINQLDQFVYTGGKIERKAAQEVMSMSVIKPNLIAYSNANDLSEVVNKVPGVAMIEGQISMRGGVGYSYSVGSRVMVLLDDMPLMGADLGDVRWSLLPIEAAEQIEVVKGATSVLYGSAALNGSINVRTGWPTAKPETKVSMFQGIYDNPKRSELVWWERTAQPFTAGTFFSHKQQLGNFDLIFSGNLNMTRSYLQLNDEYRARSFIKTRYRFEKVKGLSIGLNSMMMYQKAGRFIIWENLDSGAFKPYDGSAGQDFWKIYTIDPHITYENPNKKSTHSLKMRTYDIVRYVDKNLNRNLYDAHAEQYSLDYSYQQKFMQRFTSTVGFYGNYITAVANIYPGRYQGVSTALFGQIDYMWKRWNLSIGTRMERNRIDTVNDDRRPMIKLGGNYRAAKRTYIRANYGEGYRFPTISERYVDDGVTLLRIFPNPALQTEYGWTAEIGVKQGFKISGWNAELDYAFFWQEYTDLIEFKFDQYEKPTPEKPFGSLGFKALNVQQARVAGMELALNSSGHIGDFVINTIAGYTYSYPVNLANDTAAKGAGRYMSDFFKSFGGVDSAYAATKLLPYRNRHLVKFDVEMNYHKLNVGYALQFYSRFDNIDPLLYVLISQLDKFMNRVGTGDWVHNARIGLNVTPNFTVSFLVNNITNLEYATRPARMDAPRSFHLQVRFRI